jgi:hypothetical protein
MLDRQKLCSQPRGEPKRQLGRWFGAEQLSGDSPAPLGAEWPGPVEHGMGHVDPGEMNRQHVDALPAEAR